MENIMSFPMVIFINDFELYKNMYKSMTGIYTMPVELIIEDCQRSNNAYTIILGFYGSNFDKVISYFQTSLGTFDCDSVIEINRCKQFIQAFVLVFIGDIKQQTILAAFFEAQTRYCYWFCDISLKTYADLMHNTIMFGWYHYQVLNLWKKGNCIKKKSNKIVS